MKKYIFKIATFILILICDFQFLSAQNIIIQFKNGAELQKQIGSINKLTFSNNSMIVSYISGSSDNLGIFDINKVYFGSISTSISISEVKCDVKSDFYPNPATSIITFSNLTPSTVNVEIYGIYGVKVLSCKVSEDNNKIDISNLSNGIYIIKMGEISKKLIKQ